MMRQNSMDRHPTAYRRRSPPRIIIMADSLAMARPSISYDATYPVLLQRSLYSRYGLRAPLVVEKAQRSRTIETVLRDWREEVVVRKADIVVVHVGVVDCAPRVFSRREQIIINILGARLRQRILRFVHDHRSTIIRIRPSQVYASPERFRKAMQKIVRLANQEGTCLILVNIVSPSDDLEQRSPGFQRNVAEYNTILESQADGRSVHVLDLNGIIWTQGGGKLLCEDGHHINAGGHRLLARKLEHMILKECLRISGGSAPRTGRSKPP